MGGPGNGTHAPCPSRGVSEPGRFGSVFSPHHQGRMPIRTDATVILKLRQPLGQQKREAALYGQLA